MPIEDSPYEGRNEEELFLCAGDGLYLVKDKGHVALYLGFEEFLACFDALPGGCDLDQDSLRVNSTLFIQRNKPSGTLNRLGSVKG